MKQMKYPLDLVAGINGTPRLHKMKKTLYRHDEMIYEIEKAIMLLIAGASH